MTVEPKFVRVIIYDTLGNPVTIGSSAEGYNTNDIDEASSTITYVGSETATGVWWLKKIDETTDTIIGHATVLNNPTVTTYSAAWADRTILTYGQYSTAF